jgi:adenylate cyclase
MAPMPETPEKKLVRYNPKVALWTTLVIIFVVFVLNQFSVLQKIENQTIDFRFNVRGVRAPQAPVKIIAVDEKSLREIGQWPWPRSIHAQIIRRLKADGVKCVFYDVMFPEPERNEEKMLDQLKALLGSSGKGDAKEQAVRSKVLADIRKFQESQNGDKEFAAAIKEVGNVFMLLQPLDTSLGKTSNLETLKVSGKTPDPDTLKFTEAELFDGFTTDFVQADSLIVNIPEIQDAAKDEGHTRCFPYGDDIYRFYPTVVSYKGRLLPHLSLQVARNFLGDADPIEIHDGHYALVAGRKIPILGIGFAFIDYCGPTGTIPTISASDILYDRVKPGELKGCIAEIGTTVDGLEDVRPTPFTRNSPGVEINANIMENVISKRFLLLAPEYLKDILIILLAFAMWYLIPRLTPVQGTAIFLVLFVGYVAIGCLLFSYAGLVIDVTHPLAAMILSFGALTTYKFRTEVRHGRHMKNMFQSMVTPKVVDAILKMPSGIELGGEEKVLTVMFSDIRGFTTYSEKHSPKDVIGVLNEYLTHMTNMVFVTEGTLDKYIGDAIMDFWGAPARP